MDDLLSVMEAVAEDPAHCAAYDFLARALRLLGLEEEANRLEARLSVILGVPVLADRGVATVAATNRPN